MLMTMHRVSMLIVMACVSMLEERYKLLCPLCVVHANCYGYAVPMLIERQMNPVSLLENAITMPCVSMLIERICCADANCYEPSCVNANCYDMRCAYAEHPCRNDSEGPS